MKINFKSLAVAAVAASAPMFAAAQAAATAEPPLARHSCAKPALPDAAKKLTVPERNAIVVSLEAYRNCIRAFSDSQEKIKAAKELEAKALQDSSQAALAAAKSAKSSVDAAVEDYNVFSQAAVKLITPKASQ